jgi:hypothetical protein
VLYTQNCYRFLMFVDNVSTYLRSQNGVYSLASVGIFNLWRPDWLGTSWVDPVSCSVIANLDALSLSRADPLHVKFVSRLRGTRNSLRTWTCTVTQTGRTNASRVTEGSRQIERTTRQPTIWQLGLQRMKRWDA